MVGERAVLFRIQHFQQCRSRITPEIRPDLVHFIEEEQRVVHAALPDRRDDTARDRTDISSAVPPDLRLIPHTAQGHTDEFPPGRSGNGLGNGSLSYPRRSDQTKDRSPDAVRQLGHRQILQNPLLYLPHPVVIRIQDLFGAPDVGIRLRRRVPRKIQNRLHIVAHNGTFRR